MKASTAFVLLVTGSVLSFLLSWLLFGYEPSESLYRGDGARIPSIEYNHRNGDLIIQGSGFHVVLLDRYPKPVIKDVTVGADGEAVILLENGEGISFRLPR